MLHVRNLHVVRRLYLWVLELLSKFVYRTDGGRVRRGSGHGSRTPLLAGHERARIRRINSELEFGAAAWVADVDDGGKRDRSQQAQIGETQRREARKVASEAQRLFSDVASVLTDGVESIVGDSLTRCFVAEPPERWNFLTRTAPTEGIPLILIPLWLVSLWFRWFVLLPVRMIILLLGIGACVSGFSVTQRLLRNQPHARKFVQKWIICLLGSCFVASWGGVIRYHGARPKRRENQIFVANHTSMIDAILLIKDYPFALVAQRHGGVAGKLQDLLLSVQNHVWFDREEGRDRKLVSALLKAHVASAENEPIVVFPEGTCVNNEYCIMFKKGAFELGATVYPVAIKYDKRYADCFWNSSASTFSRHLLDLMTSWAVVADVYYLDPQHIRPGESSSEFSGRVKELICEKAGLIGVNWDGFLKRHRISDKFLAQRQKSFAQLLERRFTSPVGLPPRVSSSIALVGPSSMKLSDERLHGMDSGLRTLPPWNPMRKRESHVRHSRDGSSDSSLNEEDVLRAMDVNSERAISDHISNRIFFLFAALAALVGVVVSLIRPGGATQFQRIFAKFFDGVVGT